MSRLVMHETREVLTGRAKLQRSVFSFHPRLKVECNLQSRVLQIRPDRDYPWVTTKTYWRWVKGSDMDNLDIQVNNELKDKE
jgi:hypothetical protein